MPHPSGVSIRCLRNKLDWALEAVHACLSDAVASEAKVQSTATAHPSTASAGSSWQKVSSSPASRVSTCFEAEPIFETRSRNNAVVAVTNVRRIAQGRLATKGHCKPPCKSLKRVIAITDHRWPRNYSFMAPSACSCKQYVGANLHPAIPAHNVGYRRWRDANF